MRLFTSSGGVGDLLIVGSKLSKLEPLKERPTLHHYERHEIQEKALNELLTKYVQDGLISGNSKVSITKFPYKEAIFEARVEECYPSKDQYSINGGYIGTFCNENMDPNFGLIYKRSPFWHIANDSTFHWPYICVNGLAGRINDSTRRTVSPVVIEKLIALFPQHAIIVLGPEKPPSLPNGAEYVETPNINDALSIINECDGFIGQDGVLTYYAMMRGKPTVISFHLPELPDHYMHKDWLNHSVVIKSGNILYDLPETVAAKWRQLVKF